ncbi:hypothetical protein, partial [Aeromonas caviae]
HQAFMLQVHTFTSSRSWYTDSGCCKLSSGMGRAVAVVAYSHAWRSLNNIHADHSITSMPIAQ